MAGDQYAGISRALKLAMWTGQSVNVGMNQGGEAVKIEGIITKVYENGFLIQLEPDETAVVGPCLPPPVVASYCLADVEYVEYS